jgi:hypothetical protein
VPGHLRVIERGVFQPLVHIRAPHGALCWAWTTTGWLRP